MGLWYERRGGSIALARTYQRKPPSKIRARCRQHSTQNLMMACEPWRRSLRFERISESRRPRFEPDPMFSDYHYDYVLEKCCCTYNRLKLNSLLEFRI